MIKRIANNKWKLDFRPAGAQGARIIRLFDTKEEAQLAQQKIQSEFINKKSFRLDNRRLTELLDIWYEHHGRHLKDHKYRYQRTKAMIGRLGDPIARRFSSTQFIEYRTKRLKSVSIGTANHETRYLRAMFNELARLGYWSDINPIGTVKTLKEPEKGLTYLEPDEIRLLLEACEESRNTHLLPVVKLCLATGARFGEAEYLVKPWLRSQRVTFTDTKNGRSRTVPIDQELSEFLIERSFPGKRGRYFDNCRSAFRAAVQRSGIDLPSGQLTHVLRHSFASHFIMQGGSLKVLQEILGHSDISTTMIYAHLAPGYLDQAVQLNPLAMEANN